VRLSERLRASGYATVGEEGSIYSFDILARKNETTLALKVVESASCREAREHTSDLKRMSASLDVTPLLICDDAPEDVLMLHDGVPMLNRATVERILKRESPPFVYASRGGVYVRVRGHLIRRIRVERGMSIGDLSLLLGVTRRMVYEYESGRSDVTAEVADKLVRALGEEVLERLTLSSIDEYFKRVSPYRKISREERVLDPQLRRIRDKLSVLGFHGLRMDRAPFHLTAKREGEGERVKVIVRRGERGIGESEHEERLTLEVAKMCRSYALLVESNDEVRLFDSHSTEVSSFNLEECLKYLARELR